MRISKIQLRKIIREELTRQEVNGMIDSKLDSYIKDRDVKREIRNIAVDILDDFFREMWRKNGFWKNPLKNK